MKALLLSLLLFVAAFPAIAGAGDQPLSNAALARIRFEQKPGSQVSMDTDFRDEQGRAVRLGDYFHGKPVILDLGYYSCPMLCTLVANGLIESLQDLKADIGERFDVLSVSIDPSETPAMAAAKKQTLIRRYGRPGAAEGWHFLTGDAAASRRLAGEAGFHYAWDPVAKQFAHPSGFIVLSPEGKVVRYFFGVSFRAEEIDQALNDAARNQPESPIQELLLLCFHYSPITGKYGALVMNGVRACGLLTVAGLGFLILRLSARRDSKPEQTPS